MDGSCHRYRRGLPRFARTWLGCAVVNGPNGAPLRNKRESDCTTRSSDLVSAESLAKTPYLCPSMGDCSRVLKAVALARDQIVAFLVGNEGRYPASDRLDRLLERHRQPRRKPRAEKCLRTPPRCSALDIRTRQATSHTALKLGALAFRHRLSTTGSGTF